MQFGIVSPKLGLADSVPSIMLKKAFIQDGSENVIERYGEYQRVRGRLPDFLDITNGDKIAMPTDVFEITGIVTGTKTITIDGDHSAGNTALAAGATIRINGGTTEANNVEFTVASVPTTSTIVTTESISATGSAKGNVFVGTTPVIAYHRHIKKKTGVEYNLVGTAYNIFLWTYSDRSFAVKHTCDSACTRWEMCTHDDETNLDNVYATNNVDKVLWWNVASSVAGSFAVLDDTTDGLDIDGGTTFIVKAKHITSFEKCLMVGHLTDSDGDVHVQRVVGAAIDTGGAQVDFQYDVSTSDAWKKDFSNTPAFMMGFARSGNNIIVGTGPDVKNGRIYRGWLTSEDTPFAWVEETLKVGVLSADSFCNSKDGRLFFLATDFTVRELNTPEPISKLIDKKIRTVNSSVAEYAQATFIDTYNMIALALPLGSSTTNNKLICIFVETGQWFEQDIPVRCFGDYAQQEAYTYATLPFSTYDDWGAEWLIYDTAANVAGFHLEICADYSGYTYDLFRADTDAGAAITGTLIIGTTLDGDGSTFLRYKRANYGAYFYFNREAAGEVTIEVKRDKESDWQTVGTVSLIDTALPEVVAVHVPFDVRAKHFTWKISSSDYFEFLGMFFEDFELGDFR